MNEVQLWLLVFLQSIQLFLLIVYFAVSLILKFQIKQQNCEIDKTIRNYLNSEPE